MCKIGLKADNTNIFMFQSMLNTYLGFRDRDR